MVDEGIEVNRLKSSNHINLIKNIKNLRLKKTHKVLIADDTIYNITGLEGLLVQIIGMESLSVSRVYNGQQACELVDKMLESGEDPFTLIFMDIDMPIMDGMDAAAYIKSRIKD